MSGIRIYPAKGRYMWRDLERLAAKYGLPFRRPTAFPRNGLLAARVACATSNEPWGPEFIRRVFRANFAEDRDIADAGVIAAILTDLGRRADDLLARATADATKEALRRQTERAIALGISGAPTCVVGAELFWGNDRLEDAVQATRDLVSGRGGGARV